MRIRNGDINSNRPFQRKPEKGHQIRKSPYEDMGKLISNTSFGSCTDVKNLLPHEMPEIKTPSSTQETK